MRTKWMRNITLAGILGLGAVASLPGCAGERDLINQVQPNALKKSDLVGDYRNPKDAPEFYTRNLIMEVQRTNPWMSDGLQSLTSRVRFEITEEYVVARQAFEFVENTDGHGGVRGRTNNGRIVGAWKIKSHFDIRSDYNEQTGESVNRQIENTSDRPWYDREFVRVDWSKNLVSDPNSLWNGYELARMVKWTATPYIEDVNAREEIRSHFEEIGQGYFEVTSRWLAEPMEVDVWGMTIPYCQYLQWSKANGYQEDTTVECNPQEVTMRTSFMRVPTGDQATDYEVAEVRSTDMDVVGTLNVERAGYDVNYGIVDQNWHQLIARYNIFKKSHYAGATCGTDNDQASADTTCREERGDNSYCDMNVKLCSMPFMERETKPIVYYVDPRQPEFFYPGLLSAVGEWNLALKRAVAWSREAECRHDTTLTRNECHEKFFDGPIDPTKEDVALGDDIVVACHNPVKDGDHKFCGDVGKTVRIGDIRHHMIGWWSNPSFEAPLGVIVPGGDPTTGEEIGTIANVFGSGVEQYAARTRDEAMLVSGDITPEEFTSGITAQWFGLGGAPFTTDSQTKAALNNFTAYMARVKAGERAPADIVARAQAVDVDALVKRYGMPSATKAAPADLGARLQAFGEQVKAAARRGTPNYATPSAMSANVDRRSKNAIDAGFEEQLMNPAWLSSLGLKGNMGDERFKSMASPLRGMSPESMRADASPRPVSESHICKFPVPEQSPNLTFVAGAAAKLKAMYPDGATATGELAKAAGVEGQSIDRIVRGKLYFYHMMLPIYETTVIHEIGHLMSMEHDFTGSWDSLNFQPEYWTLRTNAGKATTACPTTGRAPNSADTCMGPRWRDPLTAEELGVVPGKEHDSLEAYSSASVMDYKPDDRFGAIRLGQMDKMAANYIYGRNIETFDKEAISFVPTKTGPLNTFQDMNFGELWSVNGAILNYSEWIGLLNAPDNKLNSSPHYTEMANAFKLFDTRRCRPQTAEEAARGVGALGLTCAPVHKDHVLVRDMGKHSTVFGIDVNRGKEMTIKEGGRLPNTVKSADRRFRWPYKVGNGQTGYFHGAVFDSGADFYEVSQYVLERYEWSYLNAFYRGGSREASPYSAGRAVFGIFDRIQDLQWNALSDVVRNGGGFDLGNGDSVTTEARRIALIDLFDALGRSLMRPQPGAYTLNKQAGQLRDAYSVSTTGATGSTFSLGLGDARYVDMAFDLTKQLEYDAYATRSGSYLEKPYAAIALTDSRPRLSTIAKETYLDGRNVMYSFRSAIPEAFDRMIGGIMADDWDTVAPYVDMADAADAAGNRPLRTVPLWETDVSKITRPATARVVDPMLGFRIKVPTLLFMMLYQPIDTNMELVNRTRIWQTGSQEAIGVSNDKKVTFWDPEQMVEWNAISFGRETLVGKSVEKGIGARMMQRANELLVAAYNVNTTTDATTGQVYPVYANGRPVGAMTVKDQAALAKLRDYVAFLNQVRAAMAALGYGPCGRGEEC